MSSPAIYSLSLHDALPISLWRGLQRLCPCGAAGFGGERGSLSAGRDRFRGGGGGAGQLSLQPHLHAHPGDRKSTRLNSSHLVISYAVFCLKKKTKIPSAKN